MYNIIYFIGSGRSGSTIVSHIIGAHPDFENIGEVYNFGNFVDKQTPRICTNGEKFMESTFWLKVRAYLKQQTGNDSIDLKGRNLEDFEKGNVPFFEALSQVSPKKYFVDSSKRIYRARFLKDSKHFNVKLIQVVRDPRAYAYSSDVTSKANDRPDHNYYRKLFVWLVKNIRIYYSNKNSANYKLVRYEDFCKDPDGVMTDIMRFLGVKFDPKQFEFWHDPQYAFSGNLTMIEKGSQEIRWDQRYLTKLSSVQWSVANLVCSAGMMLFKYPFSKKALIEEFKK